MTREHHYRLDLEWVDAARASTKNYPGYSREYVVRIEGKPPIEGSADPMFRGDPNRPNPEEMLVSALASCHMLSFLAEASRSGVSVLAYRDATEGTMTFDGGGGRFSNVTLHPSVVVAAGTDRALIARLHDRAHANCFIARSVNFPVGHEATVEVAGG